MADVARTRGRLRVTREEILRYRRRAQGLDDRRPWGLRALRESASAGLQDSMPRAALLSLHARLRGTPDTALDDPSLVQVWGPRYSAYVVAAGDHAPFTLGRLPDSDRGRRRAVEMADRVVAFLDGRELGDREVIRGLGVGNAIRYATTTGRLLIRWDGARAPTLRAVAAPDIDPFAARLELARRHLRAFGPSDADAFGEWAGIKEAGATAAFEALSGELVPVRTPVGDRWILAGDEAMLRSPAPAPSGTRLLPSGDTYYLLQGADRELLVPDPGRRASLWTSRVWPGAVLVAGDIVGTWRRSTHTVSVAPWQRLSRAQRDAVEEEAASLPLPGLTRPIEVRWLS